MSLGVELQHYYYTPSSVSSEDGRILLSTLSLYVVCLKNSTSGYSTVYVPLV